MYLLCKNSNIHLDLTAVFGIKKRPAYSQIFTELNTFGNINITENQKHFQYGGFKIILKFIKSCCFKFI